MFFLKTMLKHRFDVFEKGLKDYAIQSTFSQKSFLRASMNIFYEMAHSIPWVQGRPKRPQVADGLDEASGESRWKWQHETFKTNPAEGFTAKSI